MQSQARRALWQVRQEHAASQSIAPRMQRRLAGLALSAKLTRSSDLTSAHVIVLSCGKPQLRTPGVT